MSTFLMWFASVVLSVGAYRTQVKEMAIVAAAVGLMALAMSV